LWFYSNYHCNLACAYCLTESAPASARRQLDPALMIRLAGQAAELGFTDLGVTGGEPFLLPAMPELLLELGGILPTVALTNGTLFTADRLRLLRRLATVPVALQISLDSPDPVVNDELRGPQNFAKVVSAIPRLVDAGIRVRIATTVEAGRLDAEQHERLCALHRSLGVADEDHVVRPVIRRGRAVEQGLGRSFEHAEIPAELTVTVDGAFWSPFGPTVRHRRVDTDLLVTRTIEPLSRPADALARLVGGLPSGADARIGIR
jgi:MoaA/NifB/PqqE/SkfB family radical SAM enzyme